MNLLASPGHYQLSKNPIVAQLQGTSFYSVNGSIQEVLYAFTAAATAGQTLIFTWPLDAVSMTCAASPDDSGLQFKDNAAALSITDWVKQTIDYINDNYKMSNNFIVDYLYFGSVDCIRLRTRTKDSNKQVTRTGTVSLTEAPFTSATSIVTVPNYSMLLEVWLEQVYGGGTFDKVAELEMPPTNNPDPIAEFDLSKILSSYLDFDFPLYGQDTITKCTHNQRNYYIRYAEKFGDPIVVKSLTKSANFKVLLAGVSYQDYPASFDFFANYFIAAKQWLSFGPSTRTVTKTQQEYLYFMLAPSSARINLLVKIYFTDGTNSGTLALKIKNPATPGEIYILPTGYTQLGLDAHLSGKVAAKYDVWCTDAGGVISQTQTYVVNNDLQLDIHTFLFVNSLSGVDTLLTTGQHITGTKTEISNTERTLDFDYDRTQGQLFQFFARKYNVFTVNTGFKTKAEIDWFEELLLSGYVVEDIGGKFIPVIVNTSTIQKYVSKQNLFSLSFDYIHAYKSFAPDGSIESVLGYIIDPVGDYVVDSLGHKFILL